MAEVLRYAAFTLDGEGGNPAGVVLEADGLDEEQMQRIAAEVDYSETAFLTPRTDEPNVYDVRYFSPEQEVPFCGHATIAAAVALAEREPAAEMIFHTPAGLVTRQHRGDQRGHRGRADQHQPADQRAARGPGGALPGGVALVSG